MHDIPRASNVMQECCDLGVRFALDDFGTGYGSLTWLKQLPVDQVKIDVSFVRDMLDDPDDLAIIEGIQAMATAFRHELVAEGVEREEQGVFLLQLGCPVAQGFGVARPMPADALPEWTRTWTPPAAWRDCRMVAHADLPLFTSNVQLLRLHRGGSSTRPAPLKRPCQLLRWTERVGRQRYGATPEFQLLVRAHDALHASASALTLAHRQGQPTETLRDDTERFARELLEAREALLELAYARYTLDSGL